MGEAQPTWLRSEHVKAYCQDSGIDHEDYCKAIEYMVGKTPPQRKFLIAALRRQLRL